MDLVSIPSSFSIQTNGYAVNSVSDLGVSIAKRELSRLGSQITDSATTHRGSPEKQRRLLEIATSLMGMLDLHPVLAQFARPTLWHTDLHMGNIFVAPDSNSRITGLIDVQSLSVLPLFLRARWPVFLHPSREYTRGLVQPALPEDFNSLDEEDKATALHDWTQAKIAKANKVSTFLENRPAHNAMNVPRAFRELFIRMGEISDVSIIPLRECLIKIFQNWSGLGFPGHCPYSFSQDKIHAHKQQFARYQQWNEIQQQLAQESLDTDAEGWVAPQLDFAAEQSQNRELLSMYIARIEGKKSPEEVRRIWPFPEYR